MLAAALSIALLAGADAQPVDPAAAAALPDMSHAGLAWKRSPDKFLLVKYFPEAAKAKGVNRAQVNLACTVKAFGKLDCATYSETNPGLGFAEAALMWVDKGQMTLSDGSSAEGKRFRYSVAFGNWSPGAK